MKKVLLLILIFSGLFYSGFAQQKQDEKLRALKIAFITERLQLTSDEAQKFWPVYNSYEAEIQKLRKGAKNGDVLENEEKLLQIRKKYSSSFEKILGRDKTNALFNAEQEFRNVLIRRLKNNRQGRGGPAIRRYQ